MYGLIQPQKNNQAVTALDPTLDNYDFVKYGIQLNWTIMILLITALVQHFGFLGFFFKAILVILGGVLQMLILAVVPKVKCLKDNITTTI